MKIIVGLGNPGDEYEGTRHNAGFMILDKIREAWNFPEFKLEKKFNAEVSKGALSLRAKRSNPEEDKETELEIAASSASRRTPRNDIILAKPQTFMNLSGDAIQAILSFYKMTPDNLIVIHDDIDIALGKYRLAADSSSAGHNGVQNIIDKLGTQKFQRVRIGIGKSPEEKESRQIEASDYVLEKFSQEESKIIEKISAEMIEEIKIISANQS